MKQAQALPSGQQRSPPRCLSPTLSMHTHTHTHARTHAHTHAHTHTHSPLHAHAPAAAVGQVTTNPPPLPKWQCYQHQPLKAVTARAASSCLPPSPKKHPPACARPRRCGGPVHWRSPHGPAAPAPCRAWPTPPGGGLVAACWALRTLFGWQHAACQPCAGAACWALRTLSSWQHVACQPCAGAMACARNRPAPARTPSPPCGPALLTCSCGLQGPEHGLGRHSEHRLGRHPEHARCARPPSRTALQQSAWGFGSVAALPVVWNHTGGSPSPPFFPLHCTPVSVV